MPRCACHAAASFYPRFAEFCGIGGQARPASNGASPITNQFYRVGQIRKAEGVGLGLYITRLLVEAHGGRIPVMHDRLAGYPQHPWVTGPRWSHANRTWVPPIIEEMITVLKNEGFTVGIQTLAPGLPVYHAGKRSRVQ